MQNTTKLYGPYSARRSSKLKEANALATLALLSFAAFASLSVMLMAIAICQMCSHSGMVHCTVIAGLFCSGLMNYITGCCVHEAMENVLKVRRSIGR